MKTIKDLFKATEYKLIGLSPNAAIKGLSVDSRLVKRGELFIAVRGHEKDGHDYINDALKRGAAIICSEEMPEDSLKKAFIIVKDTAGILPYLASRFFDDPSKSLTLIGITGTNGKTTTAYLVYEILKTAGESASLLGSVQYRIRDKSVNSGNTTPDPLALHSLFSRMRDAKTEYAVMEVSSHALKQARVAGLDFKVAALTNITGDHLDYHGTMGDYVKSKRLLFESLNKDGIAVLNTDDKFYNEFRKCRQGGIITYGIDRDADFKANHIDLDINGSRFFIDTPNGAINMRTSLIGRHNVYNILAAAAISHALKIGFDAVSEAIGRFNRVPGRLESVEAGQRFKVFIDYAHTYDALENILSGMRRFCSGKLVLVFGCGGNRDRTKRAKMGKIAARLADYTVITSDNPRKEDPDSILDEIEAGFPRGFRNYRRITDRFKAIEEALSRRGPSDIVIIAGKGHEDCQIIGERILPFNDRDAILANLL